MTQVGVIMPAYRAEALLERSLKPLIRAAHDHRLLVVDPGSPDGTAQKARELGAEVLELGRRAGPAEARNEGVEHLSDVDVVLFIDCDCVIHPDVIERVTQAFDDAPELVSLTGSYDDAPPERNFASLYMNLRHHFVHQRAKTTEASFWAGCGAVRRDAFTKVGGFDPTRFPRPMIEDIELGQRLAKIGEMRLDPVATRHASQALDARQRDLHRHLLPSIALVATDSRIGTHAQRPERKFAGTGRRLIRGSFASTRCRGTALAALRLDARSLPRPARHHATFQPGLRTIRVLCPPRRSALRSRGLRLPSDPFDVQRLGFHLLQTRIPLRRPLVSRICILGGGPAGVGGAWKLGQLDANHEVTLFERNEHLGGNSGSFQHSDHWLDFGSHRLHPACDPTILADIKKLLGADLLDRPRHGRIRLMGRWVHFPLSPLDLLVHCDKSFALGSARDALFKLVHSRTTESENFETVLRANLGPTICDHFYFPYARKLWGLEPAELSAIQAHKRVSAGTFVKLLKKLLPKPNQPGTSGAKRFFYPREGFGQITRAYADAARSQGADFRLGWTALSASRTSTGEWRVRASRGDEVYELRCDHLWSTIPVTRLAEILEPAPPAAILEHARSIDYRAMILVYLELPMDQFTEFDAHYFPGEDVTLTRLSEPKNYAARTQPSDRTILCAEIPCQSNGSLWNASDDELGSTILKDLRHSGLPISTEPSQLFTQRLPQAYPIYRNGYEQALTPLDQWIASREGLLSYGRQGLFAHDNTHHALSMAYSAAECVQGAQFDVERWNSYREAFAQHVVED